MITGIDISHLNGPYNYDRFAELGLDFCIYKATEGVTFRDPMVDRNKLECSDRNIISGGYHYFRNNLDPVKQARNFCSVMQDVYPSTLPLVVDVEDRAYLPSDIGNRVLAFISECRNILGDTTVIDYTSPGYWNQYLRGDIRFIDDYLWIANYQIGYPTVPLPWRPGGFLFWQHTDKANGPYYGNVKNPGSNIKLAIDLNVSHLTRQQLQAVAANKFVGQLSTPTSPLKLESKTP